MFPSPYVTQKCFPVQFLPKLTLSSPCVPQYPCFPYSPVRMFPSPYVPQSLCPPVHLFPSPYRCSSVPMLLNPYIPPTRSPVPMYPSPIPRKCFPFPMFPKHVLQSLCSPVPMFIQLHVVHQSLYFPVLFHRSVFHSLSSPNMFPSAYVPQCLCSPVTMFPSPYVPPTSSPVPMFPSPIPQKFFFHSLCFPHMFPSAYVPQTCSPVPMFPQLVHQFLCSPVRIFPDHSYYVYILNRYYLCNNVFVCAFSWRLERVTFKFGVVPIWGELLIYLL